MIGNVHFRVIKDLGMWLIIGIGSCLIADDNALLLCEIINYLRAIGKEQRERRGEGGRERKKERALMIVELILSTEEEFLLSVCVHVCA